MQDSLYGLLWVALGSLPGGMARHLVSGLVASHVGAAFPWGTIVVNVTGSFAIGAVAAVAGAPSPDGTPASWDLFVVGFLGSYTTVSSFSLQTLALAREGQPLRASGNVLLSFAFCLAAVALGFAAGTAATGFRS